MKLQSSAYQVKDLNFSGNCHKKLGAWSKINSKKEKGYHPATFPEGLVEHCIKISDIKQGTILDPFIGSGTTIRVAKKMSDNLEDYDLSGIGIDIDEEYIKFCNETFKFIF